MYALSIKELSDDLRWLGIVDGSEVLLHRSVVVSFLIEIIAIFPEDDVLLYFVDSFFLCEIDGKDIEIPFIQNLQFLLQRLLLVAV